MFRRFARSVALLLCVLALAFADAGRAAPTYAAVALKPGDIVIGATDAAYVLDRSTGNYAPVSSDPHFQYFGILATGPLGEVYVGDNRYKIDDFRETNAIARIDPTTGTPTVVTSGGLGSIDGLAVDRQGRLFIADSSGDRIIRVDLATGTRETLSSRGHLYYPRSVAIESDGSVLTTSYTSGSTNGPRQIVRIRSGTNAQEIVSLGGLLSRPHTVAVGPDESIYASDFGGNFSPPRVVRIHPRTGTQATISTFEGGDVYGITVDTSGFVLAAGRTGTDAGIFRINPATGERSRIGQRPDIFYPFASIAMVQVGAPLPCPRPTRSPVSLQTVRLGNGRLQVNVHAAGSPNAIRSITFTPIPNAVIESPPTIVGQNATFVLKRTGPGAVTQSFVVNDACGEWKTFVGGGPDAF